MYCLMASMRAWKSALAAFMLVIIEPTLPTMVAKINTPTWRRTEHERVTQNIKFILKFSVNVQIVHSRMFNSLSHTHQEVSDNKEVLRVLHGGRRFSDGGERQRGPVHTVGVLPHQTTKLWIYRVRIHEPVSTETCRDETEQPVRGFFTGTTDKTTGDSNPPMALEKE